jgi:hypothetical protein
LARRRCSKRQFGGAGRLADDEAAIDDLVEERLFALDVVVERALRDISGAGDVCHLGASMTVGDEDLAGGIHETREPFRRTGAGHSVVLLE